MTTFKIDHIHLRSLDPEAAAKVWAAAFGATVKDRVMAGTRLRLVLDLCGQTLFIEQVAPETPSPPAPPFLGLEHIGLTVPDLDAAIAHLDATGVKLVSGPATPRPGVRIAFFGMPDGVQVELIERT